MAIDYMERARREAAATTQLRSAAEPSSHDLYGLEERCKRAWHGDANLRAEFRSFECYLAYSRASAKGLTRIIGGKA